MQIAEDADMGFLYALYIEIDNHSQLLSHVSTKEASKSYVIQPKQVSK